MSTSSQDFFTKHEFLIRRLHSLTGLVPVGAYMTVHLMVNASLLNGPATFQANVNLIHALGRALPIVEWLFIFLPIIFHAVIGVWIISTGKPNSDRYRYVNNWRYTLQRVTGVIAIIFIFTHVFHMHGWFHAQWWMTNVAEPWGMARFKPYNAASTLGIAMAGFLWPIFYFIGVVASVFHLANGIWTMGITWGVWTSARAQRRATTVCTIGGVVLLVVGLSALLASTQVDVEQARAIEDAMYNSRIDSRELEPTLHKRAGLHPAVTGEAMGDVPPTSDSPTSESPASESPASESPANGAATRGQAADSSAGSGL